MTLNTTTNQLLMNINIPAFALVLDIKQMGLYDRIIYVVYVAHNINPGNLKHLVI